MNDAIDMGMEGYGDEGDIDKAYQEVCEEVGIELGGEVGGAAKHKIGAGKAKVTLFFFLGCRIMSKTKIGGRS